MHSRWLSKIAGKYVRYRGYKEEAYTELSGWVEDAPQDPAKVMIQRDIPNPDPKIISNHMDCVNIEHVQCILKDKCNVRRTQLLLCGGRCPVKGTQPFDSTVECQGSYSDASEYN